MIDKLERLSAWLVLASGWKRYVAAFCAGILSVLSMAPFDLFPILFLTLPVFVWLMDGAHSDARSSFFKQSLSAFLLGWWFGFGYFLAGLWWIANALLVEASSFAWALPLAVVALPASLALFWGFAAVCMRCFWHEDWTRIIMLAIFLSGFEYLRGTLFTGFPWNIIGYAALTLPITMQAASLIGLYGVSLLAIIVFTAPLVTILGSRLEAGSNRKVLVFAILIAIADVSYGGYRLANNPTTFVAGVSLRLMQPNIKQTDKFNGEKEQQILSTYLTLSQGKDGLKGTTHLLWPESAFPFLLTERRDVLASIAALLPTGTTLITGAVRAEPGTAGNPDGRTYNSIYVINASGEIEAAADKVHLVPFGEYLPFQDLMETFGLEQLTRVLGGFEPGAQRKALDGGAAGYFLPLICYEIIFPGEAAMFANGQSARPTKRPDWIVNVTNDAWYGRTPGPYQHLRQSVVRGVEEGLPVVRVANTGISAVSDPFGRIIARIELGSEGIIDSQLPTATMTTQFTKYKMLPFFILLGGFFLFCVLRNITFNR